MNKYIKKKWSQTSLHKAFTLLPEFCPLQDKIQHDVNKRKNNTSQNFVWFYWQILFNIHKNMTVWHI